MKMRLYIIITYFYFQRCLGLEPMILYISVLLSTHQGYMEKATGEPQCRQPLARGHSSTALMGIGLFLFYTFPPEQDLA
jgi:hypothetical protein